MIRYFKVVLVLTIAQLVLVQSVGAQSAYRLSAGDSLTLTYPGDTPPFEALVDFDGDIRLPAVGGLNVSGLTLDETQVAIEQALSEAKLYVDPTVNVSMANYAPIVVAGQVRQPGQFPYLPQMSVATALGLSGGANTLDQDQLSTLRLLTDTQSRIQRYSLDVARAVIRLAAYRTFLDGQTTIELTSQESAQLPALGETELAKLIEGEEEFLAGTLARAEELQVIWAKEIDDLEAQSTLSSQRLDLQRTIVESAQEELAAAQSLHERGLQTSAGFASILQRSTDEKVRVLEIETAKISVDRAIAEANRERFTFTSALRLNIINDRRDVQRALEATKLDLEREKEQLSNFSDLNLISSLQISSVVTTFQIISPRPGRSALDKISLESPLLPGDTLIVTVTVN
ncbi:MAG: polysaccharide biosynthesis/export family protein [Paracoccaceae bacterium]